MLNSNATLIVVISIIAFTTGGFSSPLAFEARYTNADHSSSSKTRRMIPGPGPVVGLGVGAVGNAAGAVGGVAGAIGGILGGGLHAGIGGPLPVGPPPPVGVVVAHGGPVGYADGASGASSDASAAADASTAKDKSKFSAPANDDASSATGSQSNLKAGAASGAPVNGYASAAYHVKVAANANPAASG